MPLRCTPKRCITISYLHHKSTRCIIRAMRTTVTLSPEVAEFVDLYADAQGVSRSRAVSDLLMRSIPRKSRIKIVDGVPLLDIPANGRKTSYQDVKRIESEGY
jgi:hypothetical protein